jgi:hypothetical protein
MGRQRTKAIVSLLAVPLAALMFAGPATAATVAPDQVAGPVISGPYAPVMIGIPTPPVTFSSDGIGDPPVKYEYWINNGPHKSIKADATGTAAVRLTFPTHDNLLSVESFGAGGAIGSIEHSGISADGVLPAAEQDSNGDGVPDVLTVGDPSGLGSGLWLATGNPKGYLTGRVRTPAVNVGANGLGDGDPSFFDGAKIITGNFLGENLQDVMFYFPSGPRAGVSFILPGTGDGSVEGGGDFTSGYYLADANGNLPIDLANGYDAVGSGDGTPDLFAINGSAAAGYYLGYYAVGYYGSAMLDTTTTLTPTGETDWQNWQIFSTDHYGNTSMYLWNSTTGALDLWSGVHVVDNGDGTGSISYTQYRIAKKWNVGATFTSVQAVDFTNDGVPDLWAVTPAGVVTAYVVSNLSTTAYAKISAKAPQPLS